MKHKYFEILRNKEEHENSLNISDIVKEQEIDDQNTSNLNIYIPVPCVKMMIATAAVECVKNVNI